MNMTKESLISRSDIDAVLDSEQSVYLLENGETDESHAVHSRKLTLVYPTEIDTSDGASHFVTHKSLSNFEWERMYTTGNLVAVHMSGKVFAHIIHTHHSGKLRVTVDETTNEGRVILKDFATPVVDVDFAKVPDEVIVACVEQTGICRVYQINTTKPVTATLLVQVSIGEAQLQVGIVSRVIWCYHIPEEQRNGSSFRSGSDPSSQLILTTGGKAAVLNIPDLEKYSPEKQLLVVEKDLNMKGVVSPPPGAPIWDAKMSPDGVVFCLARQDGNVHFYQCDINKREQDMLYTWVPHDGKPVHTVAFFDDLSVDSKQDQFWMFALSGSEFGRQYRIWNCQHWQCIQIIDFLASPDRPLATPMLRCVVDQRGDYMILTDVHQNLLMFLRVDKNLETRHALVRSVNEFVIGFPIMHCGVVEMELIRPHPGQPIEGAETGFRTRLLALTQKSLEHVNVTFVGEHPPAVPGDVLLEGQENLPVNLNGQETLEAAAAGGDAGLKRTGSETTPLVQKVNGETKKNRRSKRERTRLAEQQQKHREPSSSNEVSEGVELTGRSSAPSKPSFYEDLQTLPDALEGHSAGSHQPYVLQPPSAFDGVKKAAGSHQGSPGMSSLPSRELIADAGILSTKTEDEPSFVSPASSLTRELIREERSAGSAVRDALENGFGLAMNQHLSHGGRGGSKTGSYGDLAGMSRSHWSNSQHDFETPRVATVHEQINAEKISNMETTLKAVATVVDRQSEMLNHLIRTLDDMKLASHQHGDRSPSGFERSLTQSIGQLQQVVTGQSQVLNQLEARVASNIGAQTKTLSDSVAKEVKKDIGNLVQKALKPTNDKLSQDLQVQLQSMESGIKSKVEEIVKGKPFTTGITQSISTPLIEGVKKAVQDTVAKELSTAFQQALSSSFASLNQAFLSGTQEYLNQVNRSLENHFNRMDDSFEKRARDLENSVAQSCATAISSTTGDIVRSVQDAVQRSAEVMVGSVGQKLGSVVKDELREHQSVIHESLVQALRSGIATPHAAGQQHKTQQALAEVRHALQREDWNAALKMALTVMDLPLVLAVCEKAHAKDALSKPEVLEQPVVLSLISQLSVDIATATEVKVTYLQEAILAVDLEKLDQMGSLQHGKRVMAEVATQLQQFIAANPSHPLRTSLRMLEKNANAQAKQAAVLMRARE